MENKSRNAGTLVGGAILIGLGLLALASEFFGLHGWGALWPFVIIGIGGVFLAGMASGGRDTAPLAIPGTIVTGVGVMLFLQNLTGHFESWAYGWTVIVFLVGLGIYLMGAQSGDPGTRRGGAGTMRTGLVLFIIFGAFFEGLIFRSFGISDYIFPAALILFGLYLVFKRSGLVSSRKEGRPASTDISEEK
ncbi:MAG: hypothetical protein HFACDABA_00310 [Anaerolineales bacterium]|nr:hypothetical protein [Anaerolineales bacterium]